MKSISRRNFLHGLGGTALALPWMESICTAASPERVAQRMAHFYVPIGVVRRGFFPGEADHIIPKGNLGGVMKSLGKQDPNFSVKPIDQLTPTMQPLEGLKQKINLITGMDRTFPAGHRRSCAVCLVLSE